MDKEIKEAWIEALRSGDFEQGRDYLCKETTDKEGNAIYKHCCLGVLGNVLVNKFPEKVLDFDISTKILSGKKSYGFNFKEQREFEENFFDCDLPTEIIVAVGLVGGFEQNVLIRKNDVDKLDFDQISNFIEENL